MAPSPPPQGSEVSFASSAPRARSELTPDCQKVRRWIPGKNRRGDGKVRLTEAAMISLTVIGFSRYLIITYVQGPEERLKR